jgi:hypothetical protein
MSTVNQVNVDSAEDNTASNILAENNQLNSEDIKSISQDGKNEIVICTATKTELFYIDKFGFTNVLSSCGKCDDCGLMFHESYLYFNDGVEKVPWPVFYVGVSCKDCYNNS